MITATKAMAHGLKRHRLGRVQSFAIACTQRNQIRLIDVLSVDSPVTQPNLNEKWFGHETSRNARPPSVEALSAMTPQNEHLIGVKAEGSRSFLAMLTAFEETHINPLFDQIYQHCTMWLQAYLPKATMQSRQSQLAALMTMAEEDLSQEEEIAANRMLVQRPV